MRTIWQLLHTLLLVALHTVALLHLAANLLLQKPSQNSLQLKKKPIHLAIIADIPRHKQLAQLIEWSVEAGIPYLTIFDTTGIALEIIVESKYR